VKPVQEGLFGTDDDGTPFLRGSRCSSCERLQFPMQSTCPACGDTETVEIRLSDHGTVWGWTAVTAPPPGYLGEVPFGFGVVELPEGLRVITRLEEPDPARLRFGQPVRLTLVELGPEEEGGEPVTTYSFTASTS
jgi:uncharacterized protein